VQFGEFLAHLRGALGDDVDDVKLLAHLMLVRIAWQPAP
jgi:hypothetical protein